MILRFTLEPSTQSRASSHAPTNIYIHIYRLIHASLCIFFTSYFRTVGAPSPHLHICSEADVGPFLPQCFQPGPGAKNAPQRGYRQTGIDPRAEMAKMREELEVLDARAEPTAGLALQQWKEDDEEAAEAARAWDAARVRLGAGRHTPGYHDFGAPPAAAPQHDGGNAEGQPVQNDWGQDNRAPRRNDAREPPAAPYIVSPRWPSPEQARAPAGAADTPQLPAPAGAPRPAELAADQGADAAAGGASTPAASQGERLDHRGYPLRRMQGRRP